MAKQSSKEVDELPTEEPIRVAKGTPFGGIPTLKGSVPTQKSPEPPRVDDVRMTFERWFALTGRPRHHAAGMRAFVPKVGGKRTKAAWDHLFRKY